MTITLSTARRIALAAIVLIFICQVIAFWMTPHLDLTQSLTNTLLFVMLPLIPAVVFLFVGNPLRILGACLLYIPWLIFAYYIEFLKPYEGGGAAMAYVIVILYGAPSVLLGLLVSGWLLKWMKISVVKE